MNRRIRSLVRAALCAALLLSAGCAGRKAEHNSLRGEVRRAQESKSLAVTVKKLQETVARISAEEQKSKGIMSTEVPRELLAEKANLAKLEAALAKRNEAVKLGKKREYAKALKLLEGLSRQVPAAYRGVVMADTKPLIADYGKRLGNLSRWKKLTSKLEEAFEAGTAWRYWGRPAELFAVQDTDFILQGYRKGCDSPKQKVSPYKIGWILSASDDLPSEVEKEFAKVKTSRLRARSRFLLGLLYERHRKAEQASRAFSRIDVAELPPVLAEIALRRARFYAMLRNADRARDTVTRMINLVNASRLTEKQLRFEKVKSIATEVELYPKAAAAAATEADRRFDSWMEQDWVSLYPDEIVLIYRTDGVDRDWIARSPLERKALQPAFKFTYAMLWKVLQKRVDLDDTKRAGQFAWFQEYVVAAKPSSSPQARAQEFAEQVGVKFGETGRAYFSQAAAGDWKAAVETLRKMKLPEPK